MPAEQKGLGVRGRTVERAVEPRDEVNDFQRARIVSAMIEVSAEKGYIGATVALVVARAGVSRRTFYELFEGREDCFLAAFEWGVAHMRGVLIEAYRSKDSWRERIRVALAALLALLDSEPRLARVCVIEALAAGRPALERRAELLDELAAALDASAPHSRRAVGRPVLTAEAIVGGAFSTVHGRLLELQADEAEDETEDGAAAERSSSGARGSETGRSRRAEKATLLQLHPQLMALIVLPYLGARAAGEEFTRTIPELPSHGRAMPVDRDGHGRLLERLDMRLTYRTVRCLVFIAEHPGASNREIAYGAEIADEGQASKLLGRLTRLELIENAGAGGPGLPNRWMLTHGGREVLAAVRGR